MGRTEDCFRSVRRRLDDLGYHQPLSIDSLLLVETLLNDFIELQERLKHYKEVAHHSLETCSELQLGVEPYRQDNARLVRENNQLHQQLLHERDKGDEEKRTLKKQIRFQENEIAELKYLCSNYCQEISDLQQQLAEKTFQLLDLKGVTKPASKSQSGKTFRTKKPQHQEQPETEKISGKDTHHLYDKINSLTHDIKLLKEENIELRDAVDKYQDKVRIRDDEIDRLTGLLEGGRPIMAVNKDCCCCCYCRPPASLDYQLVDKNRLLKDQLIECHEKQHEAMCHALELAERNRSLERDLKLLKPSEKACCCGDQAQKLIKMQEKLDCRQLHIDELEQEICGLKKKIKHMDEEKKNTDSILEHNLNEKKKLNDRINQLTVIEHDLMLEIERLKRSNALLKSQLAEAEARLIDTNDKVNKFQGSRSSQPAPGADPNTKAVKESKKIIRTAVRKLQVAEPQKTVPKKILKKPAEKKQMEEPKIMKVAHKEKESETSETTSSEYFQPPDKSSSDSPSPPPPSSVLPPKQQSLNENSPSWKDQLLREREIFQKQINDMERKQAEHCAKFHPPPCPAAKPLQKQPSDSQWLLLERVQAERDYYHKEFSRLRDQLCNIPDHSDEITDTLKSPINKLEKLLMERDNYHKEVCQLKELCSRLKLDKANVEDLRKHLAMKEQDILTMREKIRTLEHCANLPSVCSKNCQTTIARLELERDTARGDCVRLQEERNCLRNKLQILTETQMREHSRLEHSAMDYEERVRRLEMERRDLINKEATLRSELKMEQQKNNEFKDQIRVFNADLTQLRTNYNHVKLRQEQSERELCTSHDMLAQTEAELGRAIHRIQELEEERCCQEREIMALKNERSLFKSSIAQIDQEKDSLLLKVDEKTECNVRLEHELKSRECRIAHLEDIVADLQKKLDLALDGSARSEQNTRQALQESERLRQEIDKLERCRENALIENRRLQDDLAAMTRDWQMSNRNLEISRREVEDLKVQLQGYVTKVHRVEDILQHKEAERTEMLEQFRCLSLEATALESNNHSLESEAKSTKSELREARQKLHDLEENLHCKESLLKGYEVQIRDLTQHIASLERKLACFSDKSERCETELAAARDLSNALECQKQCFSQQIDKLQSENKNLESEVADLNNELDQLKEHLRRERKNSATLETVLASSRQETLQKNMDNNELRVQVQNLHSKICDLQDKLEHGSDALRRCQTETSDYKTQVMELKRQITSERFERARAEEAKGAFHSKRKCTCYLYQCNKSALSSQSSPDSLECKSTSTTDIMLQHNALKI